MLGIISRLRKGLEKSKQRIAQALDLSLGRGVFDDAAADEIEEALILSDIGPEAASELSSNLKDWVREAGGGISVDTVREALAANISRMLIASVTGIRDFLPLATNPEVTLVVGVNGTGKTTTAAKIAALEIRAGKTVVLGAADTFRAAAADQLKVWGERIGAPVIAQAEGADPASVAFDTVQAGISRGADRVIIDTAGRLHTKSNLMNELEKVVRVVRKLRDPVEILLVLDATTGQNGIVQVQSFTKALPLTGLVITKLDGSAKAGAVIQAVRKFSLPIKFIGVGETVDDLLPFDAEAFGREIVGGNL